MIDIGSRRELFVDRFLIDSLQNSDLRLHHPTPANTAITFEKPWEGAFAGFATVIHDEAHNLYRLYYRGWPEVPQKGDKDAVAKDCYCYAESEDGVTFTRPNLGNDAGIYGRDTNIFLPPGTQGVHSFSPFLDTNPNADPKYRFKALARSSETGKSTLIAFGSADGKDWSRMSDKPVIEYGAFDSQNVAFWSELEGCYVSYYRFFTKKQEDSRLWHHSWKEVLSEHGGGFRSIARVTSDDFLNWSDPMQMFYGDTPPEQLYTNQTHPYYRAKHIYVAMPKRFVAGRRFNTPEQTAALNLDDRYAGDVSDGCFMTTRGGNQYDRTFMQGFVRPGMDNGNWVSRTNMSTLNVVPTGENEMSMYYQHRYGSSGHYLMRYTMRPDGFASIHADYETGEIITKPLTFSGSRLLVNLSTSAVGELSVEVQRPDGSTIAGFELSSSVATFGDGLDLEAKWQSGRSLRELAGQPVRLRMSLKDADLYSLRFAD